MITWLQWLMLHWLKSLQSMWTSHCAWMMRTLTLTTVTMSWILNLTTIQLRSRSLWWLRSTNQTSTESSMKLQTIGDRFRIIIILSFILTRIKSVETLSCSRLQWLTVVWCLTWIYASLLKRTDRRTLCMWDDLTSILRTYMAQTLKSWLCNSFMNWMWQHTWTMILMGCIAANLTHIEKLSLFSGFLRNCSSMMLTQKQHSRFCKDWFIRLFRNQR